MTGIAKGSPAAIDGYHRTGDVACRAGTQEIDRRSDFRRLRKPSHRGAPFESTKPSASSFLTSAVTTKPGATALIRIPYLAHSHAIDFLMPTMPALAPRKRCVWAGPVFPQSN